MPWTIHQRAGYTISPFRFLRPSDVMTSLFYYPASRCAPNPSPPYRCVKSVTGFSVVITHISKKWSPRNSNFFRSRSIDAGTICHLIATSCRGGHSSLPQLLSCKLCYSENTEPSTMYLNPADQNRNGSHQCSRINRIAFVKNMRPRFQTIMMIVILPAGCVWVLAMQSPPRDNKSTSSVRWVNPNRWIHYAVHISQ